MNFEDLKSKWAKQNIHPVDLTSELSTTLWMKRTNTAIDKVRKNMRSDFWGWAVLMLLILGAQIVVPIYLNIPLIFQIILGLFYVVYLAISLFFVIRFIRFYRQSYHLEYDSYHNLMWFYYELRYFVDFYHAFTYVSFTLGMGCGLAIGFIAGSMKLDRGQETVFSQWGEWVGGIGLLVLAAIIVLMWIGTYFIVNLLYGRYLKQIKTTLDDLLETGHE